MGWIKLFSFLLDPSNDSHSPVSVPRSQLSKAGPLAAACIVARGFFSEDPVTAGLFALTLLVIQSLMVYYCAWVQCAAFDLSLAAWFFRFIGTLSRPAPKAPISRTFQRRSGPTTESGGSDRQIAYNLLRLVARGADPSSRPASLPAPPGEPSQPFLDSQPLPTAAPSRSLFNRFIGIFSQTAADTPADQTTVKTADSTQFRTLDASFFAAIEEFSTFPYFWRFLGTRESPLAEITRDDFTDFIADYASQRYDPEICDWLSEPRTNAQFNALIQEIGYEDWLLVLWLFSRYYPDDPFDRLISRFAAKAASDSAADSVCHDPLFWYLSGDFETFDRMFAAFQNQIEAFCLLHFLSRFSDRMSDFAWVVPACVSFCEERYGCWYLGGLVYWMAGRETELHEFLVEKVGVQQGLIEDELAILGPDGEELEVVGREIGVPWRELFRAKAEKIAYVLSYSVAPDKYIDLVGRYIEFAIALGNAAEAAMWLRERLAPALVEHKMGVEVLKRVLLSLDPDSEDHLVFWAFGAGWLASQGKKVEIPDRARAEEIVDGWEDSPAKELISRVIRQTSGGTPPR
jgi:hypothetical protein